ncbi:MAG: glutathione S-transferase [Pseudomonadota bacterium]
MKAYMSRHAVNPDRLLYFIREKGLSDEIEQVQVSIMEGEHKSSEYREKSPLAQVPTLELDDGTYLTESRAISTYLEGVYPEPNLMGADPKERAIIEMWDRRVELLYMLAVANWFRHGHPAMAPLENPQCPDWAASNEVRANKMAKYFDRRLGESHFIAGDRFTIADITFFASLGFGRVVRFEPWKELENLARYRRELKDRPCFAKG